MAQRGNRRKRRTLPAAVKTDAVMQDMYVPTQDQAEEEKVPKAVKAGEDMQKHVQPKGGTARRGENVPMAV